MKAVTSNEKRVPGLGVQRHLDRSPSEEPLRATEGLMPKCMLHDGCMVWLMHMRRLREIVPRHKI